MTWRWSGRGEAFGQYVAEADVTKLKFCRTHVHQVHGALSIVGLDGMTQVTESLENLLELIEDGRKSADEPAVSVVAPGDDGDSRLSRRTDGR